MQLSGFVDSKAMTARAVEVTRGVAGVKSVKDDMRVRWTSPRASGLRASDEEDSHANQ